MVQDLREESTTIFDVRSLIAVILTRPVRLTYVGIDANTHLEGLYADLGRKFEDLLEMDYPIWIVDPENYEPKDEISKVVETLLDLKEDVKQERELKRKEICLHLDKGFPLKCFLIIRSKHYCLSYETDGEICVSDVLDVFR